MLDILLAFLLVERVDAVAGRDVALEGLQLDGVQFGFKIQLTDQEYLDQFGGGGFPDEEPEKFLDDVDFQILSLVDHNRNRLVPGQPLPHVELKLDDESRQILPRLHAQFQQDVTEEILEADGRVKYEGHFYFFAEVSQEGMDKGCFPRTDIA